MTVLSKKAKEQDPTETKLVTEPSINDLKAQAYDELAQIENYHRLIQQCQQNINKINELIIRKNQEEARAGK